MPQLNFKGKQFVQNYHLGVKYHELIPDKEKSLTDKVSLNDNLIIHGDNLKALKALLPTYADKVKCIYIDPPYNTGNEKWVYNDNLSSPMMQDWLAKVVDKEDLTRHDKWLCMMTPRLKLLRELLSDDGAIFISIDDNEQHRLRMLMDEVFGEENFIVNFIWNHRKSSQNDIDFSLSHNHTICYSRDRELFKFNSLGINDDKFSNPDNDAMGDWVADPFDAPGVRENLQYEIVNTKTSQKFLPPTGRHWRFSKDKFDEALKNNRIIFGKTGNSKPQYKRFKFEAEEKGTNPFTIWDDVGTATEGTQQLMAIFNGDKVFETVKPVSLLNKIFKLATDKNSTILDSFAGSGTTAHAVLDLNKQDGGNRKFILVECEDYADNITAERVRRVIKGVPNAKDEKLKNGLGGSFSYFELGKAFDIEKMLSGEHLPSYLEMARYVFYTATGDEFDESKIDQKTGYIGSSKNYDVFLLYEPNVEVLKNLALTLDKAKDLKTPAGSNKRKLVFAPTKYLSQDQLDELKIDFSQLPFEIYRMSK